MSNKKVDLAEALIKGLQQSYFYDAEPNDACDRCGQLINSLAGRLCVKCLEQALADLLGDAQQAANMHTLAKAVRLAVQARDEFAQQLIGQVATQEAL